MKISGYFAAGDKWGSIMEGEVMRLKVGMLAATCALAGCVHMNDQVTFFNPKLHDAMLACNAGGASIMSASLKANISNKLVGASSLDATVEQDLKGLFLNDSSIASADREKAYEKYVGCLETMSK